MHSTNQLLISKTTEIEEAEKGIDFCQIITIGLLLAKRRRPIFWITETVNDEIGDKKGWRRDSLLLLLLDVKNALV